MKYTVYQAISFFVIKMLMNQIFKLIPSPHLFKCFTYLYKRTWCSAS